MAPDPPFIERLVVGTNDFCFEPAFFEHFVRYRFARMHGPIGFVLDAACGTRYGTSFLTHKTNLVVGIDRSHEAISFCRLHYRKRNLHFEVMEMEAIAFKANSFDTVVSFETIEHLEDPEKFLWEMRRFLKPLGALFISTPVDGELRRKLGLAGLGASRRYGTIDEVTEQWTQVLSEVLQGALNAKK